LVLAQWLLSQWDFVQLFLPRRPRRCRPLCVELGSGVAALSAIAAAYLGCDSVATDLGEIVSLARWNTAITVLRAALHGHLFPGTLCCRKLQWGADAGIPEVDRSGERGPVDLLVMADVVYALKAESDGDATKLLHDLASTIRRLSDERTVILLAHTPRHPTTDAVFFRDVLGQHGLRAVALAGPGKVAVPIRLADKSQIYHIQYTKKSGCSSDWPRRR